MLGVEATESERLLGVIRARLASGVTGARWQRRSFEKGLRRLSRDEALSSMMNDYIERAAEGKPVHEWKE